MRFEKKFLFSLLLALPLATTTPVTSSAPLLPLAVEEFDSYCYRTKADYSRVNEIVKTRQPMRLPKELEALTTPEVGESESYALAINKPKKQVIALVAVHTNVCSIYTKAYDFSPIYNNIRAKYSLKLAYRDEDDAQVND